MSDEGSTGLVTKPIMSIAGAAPKENDKVKISATSAVQLLVKLQLKLLVDMKTLDNKIRGKENAISLQEESIKQFQTAIDGLQDAINKAEDRVRDIRKELIECQSEHEEILEDIEKITRGIEKISKESSESEYVNTLFSTVESLNKTDGIKEVREIVNYRSTKSS